MASTTTATSTVPTEYETPHTIDPKYAYSVQINGNVDDYNRGYVDDNFYGIFLFALRA